MDAAQSTVSFLASPQPVQVHHLGSWHDGDLLGWRHDADGSCWVRVRAVVEGLRRTAWVELTTVRLPEPDAVRDTRPHPLLRHGRGGGQKPLLQPARPRHRAAVLDEDLHPAWA
ncbi:hypothetical protein [Blastococcus sp. TF02A-26]|uniref:hypothetical protein n=1 Tax=Blastococcus sp. TF02A-26 TaxID=2250577 RepID=UPI000DEA2468|nr:hypothetical protein [Blastococcus sp. TF02A-26]RBY89748.1 hypothetical protein DQ240_02150 [Blastococcus sp. TF02A-26]